MTPPRHVIVCGAGVMGAAVAYYLARRGVAVTVVERSGVACAASGKSGGFLALDWCDRTEVGPRGGGPAGAAELRAPRGAGARDPHRLRLSSDGHVHAGRAGEGRGGGRPPDPRAALDRLPRHRGGGRR